MIRNNKSIRFIVAVVYIFTLLSGLFKAQDFLFNNDEVNNKVNSGVCFNHKIINRDKEFAKILKTTLNHNKNLLSNIKNNFCSLSSYSNNIIQIALIADSSTPKNILYSDGLVKIYVPTTIFYESGDIFRPPEVSRTSLV